MGKENTDSPLRAGVLALEANTVAWIWLILRLLLSKGFRRLIICRTWMNFIPPKFFLDAFMALNYITSWVVNLVNATPHRKSQDADSAARMCRCVVNADWFMCRGGRDGDARSEESDYECERIAHRRWWHEPCVLCAHAATYYWSPTCVKATESHVRRVKTCV